MRKVDMSEAAILRRLKEVDQLRELSIALKQVRKPTPEEAEQFRLERDENERRMAEKNNSK